MFKISIILKSFEWHYIEKNVSFLKKLCLILDKKDSYNYNKGEKKKNLTHLKKIDSTHNKLTEMPNNFSFVSLPKKRKLFTVLRGPHVNKKSREQFHFTHHTEKLCILFNNSKQVLIFLFIIKNAELSGVEIQISFLYNSVFSHVKKSQGAYFLAV